jgi:isopentenyl diphosphate isomerase/L-lactate dehydrogenase-like FMN-dependent dehydrogenase
VRGIDGIVVTNHAGRQVDGAIASLDALEKIVDAIGDGIYVSPLQLTVLL